MKGILAGPWKFSGEFSLFLSVVTHWGGSCGQSAEIPDTHALQTYVLTQLITKSLLGLPALLGSPSTPACAITPCLHFFPQIIQVKEKLDWHFLWLITSARRF